MHFVKEVHGRRPIANVAIASDETVSGFFMLWPLEMTDGRQVVAGGQAIDVMTDPKFRRQKIFPTLARLSVEQSVERGWQVLYGAPNEATFSTYVKHLGWNSQAKILTYIRPLSCPSWIPGASAISWIFNLCWRARLANIDAFRYEKPSNRELDYLLAQVKPNVDVWSVTRTRDWLEYRYQENGETEYRWCTLRRKDELLGFAIWGLSSPNKKGLVGASLCECLAASEQDRLSLISAATEDARTAGANFMVARITQKERARVLKRRGFFLHKRSPLITRTAEMGDSGANAPFPKSWDLFGGDFDFS